MFSRDQSNAGPFALSENLPFADGANTIASYLSIKNPKVMTADQFRDYMVDLGAPPTKELGWIRTQEGWQAIRSDIEANGFDGVQILADRNQYRGSGKEEYAMPQWVAFRPEQIKSAIGNNGDFDGTNPDIRYSRTAADAPKKWDAPEPSKMDSILYKLADKQIDLKRVTEAVRDGIGEILETWDAYLKETLFHGRSAKRVATFAQKELKPLLNDMQLRGVTIPELETYLHNRHAEERNKQVAKINPTMQDGGSGIKTQDARAYLAGLTTAQRTAYEALAVIADALALAGRHAAAWVRFQSAPLLPCSKGVLLFAWKRHRQFSR